MARLSQQQKMEALALHRNHIPGSKKYKKNANTTKTMTIHMKECSHRFVATGVI